MRSVRLTLPHTHNQVTLRTISDTTTKTHIISHPAPQTHPSPVHTRPATNAHILTLGSAAFPSPSSPSSTSPGRTAYDLRDLLSFLGYQVMCSTAQSGTGSP